jgi:hypothetical protein
MIGERQSRELKNTQEAGGERPAITQIVFSDNDDKFRLSDD